jgi:hypothetical protein
MILARIIENWMAVWSGDGSPGNLASLVLADDHRLSGNNQSNPGDQGHQMGHFLKGGSLK